MQDSLCPPAALHRPTLSPPRWVTHHLVDIQGMLRVLTIQPGQGLGQQLPRVGQGGLLQGRRVPDA